MDPIQLIRDACIGRTGSDGEQCMRCTVQFDAVLPPPMVTQSDGIEVCSGRRSAGHVAISTAEGTPSHRPEVGDVPPNFETLPSVGGRVARSNFA